MSYSEHRCEGCNDTQDAAFWYYRRVSPLGYAYVCDTRYDAMTKKAGWARLEAGEANPAAKREFVLQGLRYADQLTT